jgi:hypothetical protein
MILKPPEEGAEEDTPPVIISKWLVNRTQKISRLYEPTAEDLLNQDEPAQSSLKKILK